MIKTTSNKFKLKKGEVIELEPWNEEFLVNNGYAIRVYPSEAELKAMVNQPVKEAKKVEKTK